jgi:hypothetical protein
MWENKTIFRHIPAHIKIALLFFCLFFFSAVEAQIKVYPIKHKFNLQKNASLRRLDDTLNLPFWDDFSDYEGSPKPELWMEGGGVYVNKTRGLNPPTLGVATFDGATASGGIYNTDQELMGLADSLVSRPIRLGTLSTTEVNNVYLSFFWEAEGAQEKPDAEDSLKLLFKNQNSEWVSIAVFTQNDIIAADTFVQVIYQVKPEFLHNNFQFKFESYGRLCGPYDAWHIDYVYLNKGRQVNDKNYFDRAISTLPDFLFHGYSAVPKYQFFANPDMYKTNSSVSIYNLDKIFQPIEYTAIVTNQFDSSQVIQTLNLNTPLNPILQGNQRRTLVANQLDFSLLDDTRDSIYLNLKFYISSGDSSLANGINYRINDTTKSNFVIHNYYAYDDGTAEFGAGIEQKSGKIAYMFVLNKPDKLVGVNISFINIGKVMDNTPFNLYVWKKLTNNAADILVTRENQMVEAINGYNGFQTIKLPETSVADTFYIGWEQLTNDFLVVGLDKSHDTGNRMFYNVTGDWQANVDLHGSLMIRPYFNPAAVPVGLENPSIEDEVKVYPIPASGNLNISGNAGEIKLFSINGRLVGEWDKAGEPLSIDVTRYSPGVYFLVYTSGNAKKTRKIIISR